MKQTPHRIVSFAEEPQLQNQLEPLSESIWPPFMLEAPVANQYWGRLFSQFPAYQSALLEGDTVVGVGNAVPSSWRGAAEDLPDEGWDWALSSAMADADAGRPPATLIGLQIAIAPTHQAQGLSATFVRRLKEVAAGQGLEKLIIPVRPTLKHRYPLTPIERYITWQKGSMPFDPWLRVHVRQGGRIVKACTRAMTITGSIDQWEEWTEMTFPDSGPYVIARALCPLQIDRASDQGTYIEPNVWVEHQVD
ncbi:MAG: hypothetical protein GKR89_06410 [Candidatus Latescibacteria bacterium]|nr:hypothetical protein [Candidatus Latescibacterota bacterium]